MSPVSYQCDFCLDAGKYVGYLAPDFILIDCTCGHQDNPILSDNDPRWVEYQRRLNRKVKQQRKTTKRILVITA